jgi:RNA polymerase sigma-70 factor (ECF subfamily)
VITPQVLGNNDFMGDASLTLSSVAEQVEASSELPGSARANALIVTHFDFVWRLLRRLGVPEPDVDDAAQQVFIVAANRLADIEPSHEKTFLYGTVLRTAATLRRNQRRRQRWVETAPADAVSDARGPDEEIERRQALAFLDEVLSGLDDELRDVFVLCEIEELTAAEVAQIEGIPPGTVASRLRRARRDFAERLKRLQAQHSRMR